MFSKLTPLLVLILGATSLPAQKGELPVHKAVQPKFAGVYKVASGEFIPGNSAERSGPDVIFNNMVASNYYSVPGANQEWIDDGVLNDRNQSAGHVAREDQVNGFDFIYCSTDPAPTGTITITFYDENVECAGPVNLTPLCAYAITGLPLGTATGGIQCWIVGVDLMGGFECPNNNAQFFRTTEAHAANPLFGWGILPGPNNTGPWLRRGGKGIVNDFTWYDRSVSPPIFVGCFWFGGTPFANFAIKLYGNAPNVKAIVDNDANAGNCRFGDGVAILDTHTLTADGNGNPAGVRRNAAARWVVTPTVGGQNYFLVYSIALKNCQRFNGAAGDLFTALVPLNPDNAFPMPGGVLVVNVPNNIPFGVKVTVQAFCVGGGSDCVITAIRWPFWATVSVRGCEPNETANVLQSAAVGGGGWVDTGFPLTTDGSGNGTVRIPNTSSGTLLVGHLVDWNGHQTTVR